MQRRSKFRNRTRVAKDLQFNAALAPGGEIPAVLDWPNEGSCLGGGQVSHWAEKAHEEPVSLHLVNRPPSLMKRVH